MRRALALDLLTEALGTHARLPTPEGLQALLTQTEIALFTGGGSVPPELLDAAWYLHAVGGARADLGIYEGQRRRRANQVAAHIFDVYLQSADVDEISEVERLRALFAAQVGYMGGELTPNAGALRIRTVVDAAPVESDRGLVSLQAGVLLLAFNRSELFEYLRSWRDQLTELTQTWGPAPLSRFAAVDGVVRGCYDVLIYLTYGDRTRFESARTRFEAAVTSTAASDDLDSRWVAAHLLALLDDMGAAAVWALLPPTLPAAARSMTLGEPGVMLLWPPQRAFLELTSPSPLDRAAKRLALSFPTSAGKTLLAQVLIATHIADGGGDVCVVAPTHSLCREIRTALDRRVSLLGATTISLGPIGLEDVVLPPGSAVVMTPEKLAALLHNDPAATLERFRLFVIDEAHLLGEGGRGWALEETLSLLHHLTRETDHRLVVLSAALGNRAHIVQWLDAGDGVVDRHDDWRGPRRLHAIYTTDARWNEEVTEPAAGARAARRVVPLDGAIYLRGPDGGAFKGTFDEPVGEFVRRRKNDGSWTKDTDRSTTMREHLVPLVEHLASMGQVLVVHATRSQASKLAQAVAAKFDEHPPAFALAEVAQARLPTNHPLVRVLRKGVAFHHGTLPTELQAEIEEGTRDGRIRVLVATTTLTEGVNLPFKSVVVAERGWGSGAERVEIIDAGRLLNALGRAGRAGRETEGWLILAEQTNFTTSLFAPLDLTAEDIELVSTAAQPSALNDLAAFEEIVAEGEDAVLSNTGRATDGFCSYVWFIAETLQELRGAVSEADVLAALKDTLAWHQFTEDLRTRWSAVASRSLATRAAQPEDRRRRWAKAGTSLRSAARLEAIAEAVLNEVAGPGFAGLPPADVVEVLVRNGRMAELLALPENRARGFKRRITDSPLDLIDIDALGLLLAWIGGADLEALADTYLSEVTSDDYRSEQLSEFVASVFEHHLPWTLGIVIGWVNARLPEDDRAPIEIPGHVHFGVPSKPALDMMLEGIRSRRLAVTAAKTFIDSGTEEGLGEWLCHGGIPEWRADFHASPTELEDLLAFVRSPGPSAAGSLLQGEVVRVTVDPTGPGAAATTELFIAEAADEPEPRTIVLVDEGGTVVGRITAPDHDHVRGVVRLGVELSVTWSDASTVQLSLPMGLEEDQ